MRAIVGIGNPGGKYQLTRHNVGFMLIDHLAEKYNISLMPSRYDFYYAEGTHEGHKFVLVKPTTFVNNSGSSIVQFLQQYKIKTEDMLVVYDDLNIPLSEVRIRFGGSHGGHNGIYSLIYHMNSNQFPRIRIGIGSVYDKGKMTQFVLGKLTFDEYAETLRAFGYSELLVEAFVEGGMKQMLDENSQMKDPGPTTGPNARIIDTEGEENLSTDSSPSSSEGSVSSSEEIHSFEEE